MSKNQRFVTVYLPLILIGVTFVAVLIGEISEKAGVGITMSLLIGQTWRFCVMPRLNDGVKSSGEVPATKSESN